MAKKSRKAREDQPKIRRAPNSGDLRVVAAKVRASTIAKLDAVARGKGTTRSAVVASILDAAVARARRPAAG